jgi:Ser/Thr protein kinase RdoA (MazF antagonist)
MTVPGAPHPFDRLDPDHVLGAVESIGFRTDGRLFALNSYENRVYRIGLEEALQGTGLAGSGVVPDQCVVKFYRPDRWSDDQILEEHGFGLELAAAGLPVAAPLLRDSCSLFAHDGFRFAVFECRRGAVPELDSPDALRLLGRTLGRLHGVGARVPFRHRESLDDAGCGDRARESVLRAGVLPSSLETRYARVSEEVVAGIEAALEGAGRLRYLRLHGDCHLGNLLWDSTGPVFVDLDDCIEGPAIQDLWMLLPGGSDDAQRAAWAALLEGYEQFAPFDFAQARLVEPLRALRMLNHSAWLAERWDDPAFPRAFPWFGGIRYWEDQIDDLATQLELIHEPPSLGAW